MSTALAVRTADGTTLAGERHAGDGPLVVLLHAGVADRRAWRDVAPALHARGADVVAYDRRGFGETPFRGGTFGNTDDLLAVLAAAGRGPAWLVGNSQGGRVALDVALAVPEQVAGLVLIASAVSGAPEPAEDELDPATREIVAAMERAEEAGDRDALNELEVRLWLDGPAAPDGRVGGAARALALDMNAIALASGLPEDAGAGGEDAWSRLGEIRAPATVAWGDLDVPAVIAESRAAAERLANVRAAVELAGVAHLPALERPDLVAGLVTGAVGL